MDRKETILIYGIGNDILTDDGIGPKIVKRLKGDIIADNISYDTSFLGGMELLEYIQGNKTVIFIDAIKTKDGIPGEIYYLKPENFKETLHLSNIHDVSFLTALKLGSQLGLDIPENIHIIAIEIVEDLVFSNKFSAPLETKFEDIYYKIREFVLKFIKLNLLTNTTVI